MAGGAGLRIAYLTTSDGDRGYHLRPPNRKPAFCPSCPLHPVPGTLPHQTSSQKSRYSRISSKSARFEVTSSAPCARAVSSVVISGVADASFNASITVVSVLSNNPLQFTYTNSGVNGSSSGGIVSDQYGHVLVTSDNHINNEHVSVTGSQFFNGGMCWQDYYPGNQVKDGLTFSQNRCFNTFGPEAVDSGRTGVDVEGNEFNLSSGGQEIAFAGDGLKFIGNHIVNGYVYNHGLGSNQIYTGNYFQGNYTAPLTFAFDICSSTENIVFGNIEIAGSYNDYVNKSCGSGYAVGYKKLDIGVSTSPVSFGVNFSCSAIGDTVYNSFPDASNAVTAWICNTVGTPGIWSQLIPADNNGNVVVGGTLTLNTIGSTGKTACIRADKTVGYCSSQVGSNGNCTCN